METFINKGDINKKAVLVVSFGTSYKETRAKTIGAIEQRISDTFPEYELRRAFTSQIIIDKLKSRDGVSIDNVGEAMQRLARDGFGTLIVQPTHVMAGLEFEKMMNHIKPHLAYFQTVRTGSPLLTYKEDFAAVAAILLSDTAAYYQEGTSVVFMGHGTEHEANQVYPQLEQEFARQGADQYFIGTVESEPSIEDVMEKVRAARTKKVLLLPLMIVAGDHAANDMAGDDDESWKSRFEAEGYKVMCVLKGLGEYPGIQDLFVSHISNAIYGSSGNLSCEKSGR